MAIPLTGGNSGPILQSAIAGVAPTTFNPFKLSTANITFTGGAGAGAIGNVPVFAVTGGLVFVHFIAARCTTTLVTTTGTVAMGLTGDTLKIIGTTSVMPTTGQIWCNTTPSATSAIATNSSGATATTRDFYAVVNIVIAVATAAVTAGVLEVDCLWCPLTAGATLL